MSAWECDDCTAQAAPGDAEANEFVEFLRERHEETTGHNTVAVTGPASRAAA